MNWAVVIIGFEILLAVLFWIVQARHTYIKEGSVLHAEAQAQLEGQALSRMQTQISEAVSASKQKQDRS